MRRYAERHPDGKIHCMDEGICKTPPVDTWEEAWKQGWTRRDLPGWLHYYCPTCEPNQEDYSAPKIVILPGAVGTRFVPAKAAQLDKEEEP